VGKDILLRVPTRNNKKGGIKIENAESVFDLQGYLLVTIRLAFVTIPVERAGQFSRHSDCSTGWKTKESFDSRQGQEVFLFSTAFRPALGAISPEVK
jgi:hypothetical protein